MRVQFSVLFLLWKDNDVSFSCVFFYSPPPHVGVQTQGSSQSRQSKLALLSLPVGFSRRYPGVVSFVSILLGLADPPTWVSRAFSWS